MRYVRVLLLQVLLSSVVLVAAGPGAGYAAEPLIQLNTGGHTTSIRGLAYAFDKRLIISGGYDKVIRVWDLNKGETVSTLRGESGLGDFGNIYALVASPIDRTVAVGGYMAPTCPGPQCGDIRLFNYESGTLVGLLSGTHSNIVLGLAFSPNGRYLASAGADDRVVVWNVAERKLEAAFPLPKGAQPNAVVFLPDNAHLISAGRDGIVRMLDRTTLATVRTWKLGGSLDGLAVSRDGRLIAVGGSEGRVSVIDAQSGETLREIANGSPVAALAFGASSSIHHLAVGAWLSPFNVNVWDADSGKLLATHTGHDNTVQAVTFSAAGSQVYSAGGSSHEIHLWSPKDPDAARRFKGGGATVFGVGLINTTRPAPPSTALQPGTAAAVAATRSELYVAWGQVDPCPTLASCPEKLGKLQYALRLPSAEDHTFGAPEELARDGTLQRRPGALVSADIRRAVLAEGEQALERTVDPAQSERFPELKLKSAGGEAAKVILRRGRSRGLDHLSYGIGADGKRIYSGGRNGVLDSVAPDGSAGIAYVGHSGDVIGVADSAEGKLLVSGASDQTVRFWNAATGELIASLLYMDLENWVMWTPQGYYVSSPGGDQLVGWQVNRGRDTAAQFFTARSLRKHFYKPEVVAQALLRLSAVAAVKELGDAQTLDLNDLDKHQKPKLKFLSPRGDTQLPAGRTRIKVDLSGNEDDPIDQLSVYVNERKLDYDGPLDGTAEIDVPLELGSNLIRVSARNGGRLTTEMLTEISCETGTPPPPRGKLTVIAIGVNLYPNKSPGPDGNPSPRDLQYSAADAEAMLALFTQRLKGRHASAETLLLVNGADAEIGATAATADKKLEPTAVNIEGVLDRVRKMKSDDTLIIFIAGHGINLPNDEGYVFLPQDARFAADGWDSGHLVKWRSLEGALQVAKGRRFLFVDTCQSAGAVNGQLIKPLADEEVVAFMAASREQDSWEFPNLKHGVFTSAVLSGLAGAADSNGDHVITVVELGNYIVEQVLELTEGGQLPDSYKPRRDFALMRY